MKLVRVDGVLEHLDELIASCCLNGNFHPEPAIQHMSGSLGYITLSEDNPYSADAQRMEELFQLVGEEVPPLAAQNARDVGFDRGLIGAYGQDDRIDAYPALMAEIEAKAPAFTTVCVLTDKEEIGSDGVTGLASMYVFHFLQQLCAAQGADDIACFQHSKCLSADVTAAYDPTFASGSAEGELKLESPGNNINYIFFTIALDETGELIYESGLLKPNSYIYSDRLQTKEPLPKGTYPCTATVHLVDRETLGEIGTVQAALTLTVQS